MPIHTETDPIAYMCPCGFAVFVRSENSALLAWKLVLARGLTHARTCPHRRVTVAVLHGASGPAGPPAPPY